MKSHSNRQTTLRNLLRRAYYQKEGSEISGHWRQSAMQRIRDLGPQTPRPAFVPMFEQLIWRLAPAAAMLIVVLAMVLLNFDMVPDADIFQVFYDGFNDLGLMSIVTL